MMPKTFKTEIKAEPKSKFTKIFCFIKEVIDFVYKTIRIIDFIDDYKI